MQEPIDIEGLGRIASQLWKANKQNSEKLAVDLYSKFNLPPAAPLLITNLAGLLAEIQKQSFLVGAIAALYSMEQAMRKAVEDEKQEALRTQ